MVARGIGWYNVGRKSMVLNLLKFEITCRKPSKSENTIFCRMVSVTGSGFQCRIDAFNNRQYLILL